MINRLKKVKVSILLISTCFVCSKILAQKNTIIFIADTLKNRNYTEVKVTLFQQNKIWQSALFKKIEVKSGITFQVEFESKIISIPGYKNVKIYSDTIISIDIKSLRELTIKSKKQIITETLTGYSYYPQNDSIFKDKPILYGLQRLPFISIENENSLPKYKSTDAKILFLLNGKQRKGLENTWINILRVLKSSQVYKVELMEDIPQLYINQGYTAVINILTLDENIYGESFNAAITGNQRKDLNIDTKANFLRKKTDLSISAIAYSNNNIGNIVNSVYESDSLMLQNKMDNISNYKHIHFLATYGNRVDSSNDIAFSIRVENAVNNSEFNNIYSSTTWQNNSSNKIKYYGAIFNGSWIKHKTAHVTKSLSFAININKLKGDNRLSFIIPKNYDSISRENIQNEMYSIAEYNILNTRNPNFQKEIGIQIYFKQNTQDFYLYNINPANNENSLLIGRTDDTTLIKQLSIRPYFKMAKNFSKDKRFVVSLFPEVYNFFAGHGKNLVYFLPNTRMNFKKIISDKLSIRNSLEFSFIKPGIDYLLPVILENNPIEKFEGNNNIKPGKSVENFLEIVRRKKSNISLSLGLFYNFNEFDFFSQYDTMSGKILNYVNNGKSTRGLSFNFLFQFPFHKKFSGSISSSISWLNSRNKEIATSYSGVFASGSCFFQYNLGKKAGGINFLFLINAKRNNGQGYNEQPMRYAITYANRIAKNFNISLTAENFFLKNVKLHNFTYTGNFKRYTDNTRLYRMLSLRVGYFFSNIKISRYSQKRFTEIENEKVKEK